MVIERISVKTLRQEVYDQLRDKIISAEILPGEAVSLRGLAEKFGVSLMPVREALWQLESERIIVIESNKRIRVNSLTAKEMEEALRLRLLLESTAAERACDLRPEEAVPQVRGHSRGDGGLAGSSEDLHAQEHPVSFLHLRVLRLAPALGDTESPVGPRVSVRLYLRHSEPGQGERHEVSPADARGVCRQRQEATDGCLAAGSGAGRRNHHSCPGTTCPRIAKGTGGSRPIEPPRRQACQEHRRSAGGFPGTGSGGSAVAD